MLTLDRTYFFCPICGNVNANQNSKCINCQIDLVAKTSITLDGNKDFSKYIFERNLDYKIASSILRDSNGLVYKIEGGNAFRINIFTRAFFLLFVIVPFILLLISSLLDFSHFQSYLGLLFIVSIFSGIFYLFTYLYSLRDYNTITSEDNTRIGQLKNEFSFLKILLLSKSDKWSFYDSNNKKVSSIDIRKSFDGLLKTPNETYGILVNENKQAMRYYRNIIEIIAMEKTTKKTIILQNNPTPKTNEWKLVENPKEFEIYAQINIDSRLVMFFTTILVKKFFINKVIYGLSS